MKSNFFKKFNSKIGFLLSLLLKRTEDEVYISKNISFNSVLLMHFKIDSISSEKATITFTLMGGIIWN